VHPVERLRAVARSPGPIDPDVAAEIAVALADVAEQPELLVVSARRLVAMHPEWAVVWWLAAQVLAADDPVAAAWVAALELAEDRTPEALASALAEILTGDESGRSAPGSEATPVAMPGGEAGGSSERRVVLVGRAARFRPALSSLDSAADRQLGPASPARRVARPPLVVVDDRGWGVGPDDLVVVEVAACGPDELLLEAGLPEAGLPDVGVPSGPGPRTPGTRPTWVAVAPVGTLLPAALFSAYAQSRAALPAGRVTGRPVMRVARVGWTVVAADGRLVPGSLGAGGAPDAPELLRPPGVRFGH